MPIEPNERHRITILFPDQADAANGAGVPLTYALTVDESFTPGPPPVGSIAFETEVYQTPSGQQRWAELPDTKADDGIWLVRHGADLLSVGSVAGGVHLGQVASGIAVYAALDPAPLVDAFGEWNVRLYPLEQRVAGGARRLLDPASTRPILVRRYWVAMNIGDGGGTHWHLPELLRVETVSTCGQAFAGSSAGDCLVAVVPLQRYRATAGRLLRRRDRVGPAYDAHLPPPERNDGAAVALVDGGIVVERRVVFEDIDGQPTLHGEMELHGDLSTTAATASALVLPVAKEYKFDRVKVATYRYQEQDLRYTTEVRDPDGHGTAMAGALAGSGKGWWRAGATYRPKSVLVQCVGADPAEPFTAALRVFDAATHGNDGKPRLVPDHVSTERSGDGLFGLLMHASDGGYSISVLPFANEEVWGERAYATLSDDVDRFVGEHDGHVVLVPAGNRDPFEARDGIGSPGTARNAITVGMTPPPGAAGDRERVSRVGFDAAWELGVKPDVLVDGWDAVLPRAPAQPMWVPLDSSSETGGSSHAAQYGLWSGTSVSTARLGNLVSGLRARNPSLGAAGVKALVIHVASAGHPWAAPSPVTGWGEVPLSGDRFAPVGPAYVLNSGVAPESVRTFDLTAAGDYPVAVTLVWLDRPTPLSTVSWQDRLVLALRVGDDVQTGAFAGPQVLRADANADAPVRIAVASLVAHPGADPVTAGGPYQAREAAPVEFRSAFALVVSGVREPEKGWHRVDSF